MRYYLLILFGLILSGKSVAQVDDIKNSKFEIVLDSIERTINMTRRDADTNYYIHYRVKNISTDTLTYVTNSCFYYNHYSLKAGQTMFDLNPSGGCLYNGLTNHKLSPGESFKMSEWISAANLNTLQKGIISATLQVPIVKDNDTTYRVDGRSFVKNAEYLIFNNQTKVTETYIGKTRRKKRITTAS